MKWLPMALLALTKIPLEKIFVRQPDPMKKVERLESLIIGKKQAESPVSEPAPQQHPAEIPIAWLAVLASPGAYTETGKNIWGLSSIATVLRGQTRTLKGRNCISL